MTLPGVKFPSFGKLCERGGESIHSRVHVHMNTHVFVIETLQLVNAHWIKHQSSQPLPRGPSPIETILRASHSKSRRLATE